MIGPDGEGVDLRREAELGDLALADGFAVDIEPPGPAAPFLRVGLLEFEGNFYLAPGNGAVDVMTACVSPRLGLSISVTVPNPVLW